MSKVVYVKSYEDASLGARYTLRKSSDGSAYLQEYVNWGHKDLKVFDYGYWDEDGHKKAVQESIELIPEGETLYVETFRK